MLLYDAWGIIFCDLNNNNNKNGCHCSISKKLNFKRYETKLDIINNVSETKIHYQLRTIIEQGRLDVFSFFTIASALYGAKCRMLPHLLSPLRILFFLIFLRGAVLERM